MENRIRIIEEAALIFRTYGIRAVTMDMLANQLGISKRTIYEVFKDKDELLEGVLVHMKEKQCEMMDKIMAESENVIEAIFKIIGRMMDHFQNMSPAFQTDIIRYHHSVINKLGETDHLPYQGNNNIFLVRGAKEGIIREDINLEIVNSCIIEIIKLSNNMVLFPLEKFSRTEIIRDTFINYLRGICTQKGLELVKGYEQKLFL